MNFQSNNFTTYQLIQESYQMNFVVAKINDSTVKISWNLPVDENNSTANLMYNGLVIIASSVPINTKLVNETKYEDDKLTHIMDKRYDAMLPTMLITNVTRQDFAAQLSPSIISRIRETGGGIECNWDSYRKTPNQTEL